MPLFGGGSSAAPAANSAQLEAATAELDMITDVFNRLVESCHKKCISTRYAEPDLLKGESVCIDRCVSKFFAVNAKVGEQMQAIGQQASGAGAPGGRMFG
ncbi:protein transporter tim10 [Malassezia japonica]|uniref:Mitochondrial import inner membrane translocase subunit n=1 Tax=Malassezia japonica TaxID=223818 RepID=A0AAF0J8V8_9BASI|nr:protein transporter tim10 [Malassezia japonica]WFD37274.1 protein transporter tim10 [Malassezia japonica]